MRSLRVQGAKFPIEDRAIFCERKSALNCLMLKRKRGMRVNKGNGRRFRATEAKMASEFVPNQTPIGPSRAFSGLGPWGATRRTAGLRPAATRNKKVSAKCTVIPPEKCSSVPVDWSKSD